MRPTFLIVIRSSSRFLRTVSKTERLSANDGGSDDDMVTINPITTPYITS